MPVSSSAIDLRFSLALCDKEKLYRQRRREQAMLGIKKLLDMEKPRFLPSRPQEVYYTHKHSTLCISNTTNSALPPKYIMLYNLQTDSLQPVLSGQYANMLLFTIDSVITSEFCVQHGAYL